MGIPRHVAIIMDGNGRWAAARGLPRAAGHKAGVEALRGAVRTAGDLGIKTLTVYAFSSENWSRPPSEVADLMMLLKTFIRRDLADLHKANVRVRIIGSRKGIEPSIMRLLQEAETLTARNTAVNLVVAFNYGSRDEITRAAAAIAAKVKAGLMEPADVTEAVFAQHLDTAGLDDPDVIIRTSGEQRLSNFLMWQAAYSEFVFPDCFWPDFDAAAFKAAIEEFERRERRFGGVVARDAVS